MNKLNIYYFEKGWRLNEKLAKKRMKKRRNKIKDFNISMSGISHQINEYYLKSDIDKLLKGKNKYLTDQEIVNNIRDSGILNKLF